MIPVVLIHGALGCSAEIEPLTAAFRAHAETRAPNLPGHGGRPIPERLSIRGHAEDLIAYLDREAIGRAFFVGYSLGGYIALYLARHFPARVHGAASLAAKFVFDPGTVRHWTHLADPARLRANGRALVHEKNHAPQDWVAVAHANARLFEELGREPALRNEDLAAITVPVMVVGSDRDQIVPWTETRAIAKLIPGSELAMFYGAAHPLAAVPVLPVARTIAAWTQKIAKKK